MSFQSSLALSCRFSSSLHCFCSRSRPPRSKRTATTTNGNSESQPSAASTNLARFALGSSQASALLACRCAQNGRRNTKTKPGKGHEAAANAALFDGSAQLTSQFSSAQLAFIPAHTGDGLRQRKVPDTRLAEAGIGIGIGTWAEFEPELNSNSNSNSNFSSSPTLADFNFQFQTSNSHE